MIVVRGAGRSHRRAVSSAGGVVAERPDAWRAASVAVAEADRRHTAPGPHRQPVAGRASRVRALGPGSRSVPPVAAGRHAAPDPLPAPVPGRLAGLDRVGSQRRLHGVSGPSTRGRSPKRGELQKEPPGGVFVEPDDCRARAEAHIDRRDRRAAERLSPVRDCPGACPRSSSWSRRAPNPPAEGTSGPGVCVPWQPRLPAQAR